MWETVNGVLTVPSSAASSKDFPSSNEVPTYDLPASPVMKELINY